MRKAYKTSLLARAIVECTARVRFGKAQFLMLPKEIKTRKHCSILKALVQLLLRNAHKKSKQTQTIQIFLVLFIFHRDPNEQRTKNFEHHS